MNKERVFIDVSVDVESVDNALAEILKAQRAFAEAVYKLRSAVDHSMSVTFKGNPALPETERD